MGLQTKRVLGTQNADWAAVIPLSETWPAMMIGIAVFAGLTFLLYSWIIRRSATV